MLYRIKIVGCLDIVYEADCLEDVREYAYRLARDYCVKESKKTRIYIHVLEEKSGELVDKGLVYHGEFRGV